jgi:tRNA threonylcarbamoyladenosine biosynthesis protein TsaB
VNGLTLALDASTYSGTVAIGRGGYLVAERVVAMRGREEERLMPAVAAALASVGGKPTDITSVICGAGPGSFTSLRIAASIAKGLATALSIPLFAVSSLGLGAVEAGPGRWLVTLDALRGEVFAGGYAWIARELVELAPPRLISAGDAPALAVFLEASLVQTAPHARAALRILDGASAGAPVDVASWEPDYGRLAEAQVRWEAAHGRPLRA